MDPISTVPEKGPHIWFKWCLKWGLRGLAAVILLIVLFYVEEDLRGAYAWSKAKQELAARGISLDPNLYIPPLIPEAENFGALPLFKLEPDPKQKGLRQALALRKALEPLSSKMPYSKEQAAKVDELPYLDLDELPR